MRGLSPNLWINLRISRNFFRLNLNDLSEKGRGLFSVDYPHHSLITLGCSG